jgi:hypothetical protein
MSLGLIQPLTEMSTRNISWGYRRPVRRADNLTTFMCRLSWNLEDSSSWNTLGLSRLVIGLLYLYHVWLAPANLMNNSIEMIGNNIVLNMSLTLILLMWRIGWAPNNIPIYIQQHVTLHSLFISGNYSTCFGWYFHPSSGGHTTVSTASGICHIVTVICRYQLEPVWVCCGWRTPPTAHSNRLKLFHDSSR